MIKTVRSIREQIVDDLRSDVLCCRIHPGARLAEMDLAKRFGVGRGAIREALSQLVSEGLLIAKPNCGVTVASPPTNEVRELIIPIRRTVETYALKSYFKDLNSSDFDFWRDILKQMDAAGRRDDVNELVGLDLAFHRSLVARASQPELLGIWQSVVSQIRGHFGEKIRRYSGRLEVIIEPHRRLVEIIQKGNCKEAVRELRRHIA
ncbi:MAG: GntR family transcriptional regulator [Planctomyces sp.]|jgi:DNA-binding GntR family transcriptional regulator